VIVYSIYSIITHWVTTNRILSKRAHRGSNPKAKAIGYKRVCVCKELGFACDYLNMATSLTTVAQNTFLHFESRK